MLQSLVTLIGELSATEAELGPPYPPASLAPPEEPLSEEEISLIDGELSLAKLVAGLLT